MKDILTGLSKTMFRDSDEIHLESSFKRIKRYYEENSRHRYSEISQIIYTLEDEQIDILRINLEELIKFGDGEDKNILKNIEKLIDHADLAQYQRKFIEKENKKTIVYIDGIHKMLQVTKKELLKERRELNDIKKEHERISAEVDNHKSNVYTQFVTILGIFSAIVFASFGGLELLNNILGNMKGISTPKLLVFSSLSVGAIVIILFILLSGISIITQTTLRSCGCTNGFNCKHSIYSRHPTIMLISFILLYIAVIGGFGFIVDYKEIMKFKSLFSLHTLNFGSESTFKLFLILYPIIICFMFLYKRREDKRLNEIET